MERTKPGSAARIAAGLGIAAGAALITALGLLCLFAAVLAWGAPDGLITPFVWLTAVLAALTAGFCAGKKTREGGLKIGLLAGATVFLLHLIAAACFGAVTATLFAFLPAELICGAAGGIIAVNLHR